MYCINTSYRQYPYSGGVLLVLVPVESVLHAVLGEEDGHRLLVQPLVVLPLLLAEGCHLLPHIAPGAALLRGALTLKPEKNLLKKSLHKKISLTLAGSPGAAGAGGKQSSSAFPDLSIHWLRSGDCPLHSSPGTNPSPQLCPRPDQRIRVFW